MSSVQSLKWLLLIHQIPPKPNALRVKIWRRLQQVGAVAIKQSVYVMPHSQQSREDLSWTLKEIIHGGGDGSISEVQFVDGLTDEQVRRLFYNARKSDYDKLINEANALMTEWSTGKKEPVDHGVKGPLQLTKLQRRLNEIAAIDFFKCPEYATAELLLKELETLHSSQSANPTTNQNLTANLTGKIWVTRSNIFVDRIACSWLIRRFVDQKAVIKFVPGTRYSARPDEISFDMYAGEFTHEGDKCTFEVMIQRLKLEDHALVPMAEVVHDIDLKDDKYSRSQTDGFSALLAGLVASIPDDELRLKEGCRLFDNLYAYFSGQKRDESALKH